MTVSEAEIRLAQATDLLRRVAQSRPSMFDRALHDDTKAFVGKYPEGEPIVIFGPPQDDLDAAEKLNDALTWERDTLLAKLDGVKETYRKVDLEIREKKAALIEARGIIEKVVSNRPALPWNLKERMAEFLTLGPPNQQEPLKSRTFATCSKCGKVPPHGFGYDPPKPLLCEECAETVVQGVERQARIKEAADRVIHAATGQGVVEGCRVENPPGPGKPIEAVEEDKDIKPKLGWATLIKSAKAGARAMLVDDRHTDASSLAAIVIACSTAICMAVEANSENLTRSQK